MKTTLAFETSTATTSIALLGADGLKVEKVTSGHNHCEQLLPLTQELLADSSMKLSDIDRIAVGHGPGSFTGLRIGLATAKGICLATSLPLYSVSSLAALAKTYSNSPEATPNILITTADARRGEIFAGYFEQHTNGDLLPLQDEEVISPEKLVDRISQFEKPYLLVGEGVLAYPTLGENLSTDEQQLSPSAIAVAELALKMSSPSDLTLAAPRYARAAAAEVKFPKGNPGGAFAPSS